MNNNITSGFDIAAEIASIAIDEFKVHYVTKNFSGLLQRYYHLVEEDFGGRLTIIMLIILTLNNYYHHHYKIENIKIKYKRH